MRDLKDRLQSLGKHRDSREGSLPPKSDKAEMRQKLDRIFRGRATVKYFAKPTIEKEARSISELIDGRWINTPFGDIFRAEFQYPLAESYGNLELGTIFNVPGDDYEAVFQIPKLATPAELLFIDTETTGLTGGTGTLAFMVGLGWIDGEVFSVHQYFITQLSHEEGMLELIHKFAQNFRGLVSYNGKSFDIPLLNSRFVLNRLPPLPEDMPHIDLLHPTRTIWRYSMDNCKLKTLESDLLGLEREGDIPGEMIPDVYFDYLRNRKIERIERIFYHNRFDIVTMLASLILIFRAHHNLTPEENPLTDFAKGKLFTRRKDSERSMLHFKNVLQSDISGPRRQRTYLELARLYKQSATPSEAVALWQKALNPDFPFVLEPFVELAKYYEHKMKDYSAALKVVERALQALPIHRERDRRNLEKRRQRLYQKATKNTS